MQTGERAGLVCSLLLYIKNKKKKSPGTSIRQCRKFMASILKDSHPTCMYYHGKIYDKIAACYIHHEKFRLAVAN